MNWHSLRSTSTADIIRARILSDDADAGAGVLWSDDPTRVCELSAYAVIAWEGRPDRPHGTPFEWVGSNLLCNAAPTSFELNDARFGSVESFYESLKFPEGTADRDACAMASASEARRMTRRLRNDTFVYREQRIEVGSVDHEALVASAIVAKVAQHQHVQHALRDTGNSRLVFSRVHYIGLGVLGQVTPLVLMIERWKRFGRVVPR